MKTIQDLKDIKNQKGAQVDIRFGGDAEAEKTYILCRHRLHIQPQPGSHG